MSHYVLLTNLPLSLWIIINTILLLFYYCCCCCCYVIIISIIITDFFHFIKHYAIHSELGKHRFLCCIPQLNN